MKLYEGVEITIPGMVCACVKISVESVVESLMSRNEKHFNKERNLTESNALDELEIAENGPTIFKADNILVSAMNKYWNINGASGSAKWHLTTASIIFHP